MRTILITLILVGLMESLSGLGLKTGLRQKKDEVEALTVPSITTEPQFTQLNGSLFLAVKTNETISLSEGAIVEFKFKRKKFKSFHVNDANQDILNQGKANILVMIHQDLALALKTEKLEHIKLIDGPEAQKFKVDEFWPPHIYLTKQ